MKAINLKVTDTFNQIEQLQNIVKNSSTKGYTIAQVRMGNKILDRIDNLDDFSENSAEGPTLILDDSEWNFVKERIEETQWLLASIEIEEFADAIFNAKDV